VRRPVTVSQRVRARLARAMFGADSHIPKPTPEEYRELTGGHGGQGSHAGHGGRAGHGGDGGAGQ
jgi:ubiquinol-cytochrome c reductase cytochrome b subunit